MLAVSFNGKATVQDYYKHAVAELVDSQVRMLRAKNGRLEKGQKKLLKRTIEERLRPRRNLALALVVAVRRADLAPKKDCIQGRRNRLHKVAWEEAGSMLPRLR